TLQVLVDFVSGRGPAEPPDPVPQAELPPTGRRRSLDQAFADALRESGAAQRREVRFALNPGSAGALTRALTRIGVPDVRPCDWRARPELAFGVELPGALHDGIGWPRTWFVDRDPGGAP